MRLRPGVPNGGQLREGHTAPHTPQPHRYGSFSSTAPRAAIERSPSRHTTPHTSPSHLASTPEQYALPRAPPPTPTSPRNTSVPRAGYGYPHPSLGMLAVPSKEQGRPGQAQGSRPGPEAGALTPSASEGVPRGAVGGSGPLQEARVTVGYSPHRGVLTHG